MSLLHAPIAPETPPTPPKEELLRNAVNEIKSLSQFTFKRLLDIQEKGINLLWNDGTLTPQEIIDELGEDALKTFQFHGALTDLLQSIMAQENLDIELAKPTNAFTVDLDTGTITVTDDPYEE